MHLSVRVVRCLTGKGGTIMKSRARSRRDERMDPSPKTIRERSAAIRDGWSERERAKRAGIIESAWTPPRVHRDELPEANSEHGMAGLS